MDKQDMNVLLHPTLFPDRYKVISNQLDRQVPRDVELNRYGQEYNVSQNRKLSLPQKVVNQTLGLLPFGVANDKYN